MQLPPKSCQENEEKSEVKCLEEGWKFKVTLNRPDLTLYTAKTGYLFHSDKKGTSLWDVLPNAHA